MSREDCYALRVHKRVNGELVTKGYYARLWSKDTPGATRTRARRLFIYRSLAEACAAVAELSAEYMGLYVFEPVRYADAVLNCLGDGYLSWYFTLANIGEGRGPVEDAFYKLLDHIVKRGGDL